MTKQTFKPWVLQFVHERTALRAEIGNLVLFWDGSRGHISFNAIHALQ